MTLLGKNKKIKIQSLATFQCDDKTKAGADHTDPFNPKNIKHSTSIDELLHEHCQKIQANLDADLKAILESCTNDRWKKVTQFSETNFGDSVASTSASADVKGYEKGRRSLPYSY